jgi:hypothetical protein
VKRILLLALVVIALIAACASQTWFVVSLTSGNDLLVTGLEAYPNYGPTLIMDALAIAIVLYLKSRWRVIFLITGVLALTLLAVSQLSAATGQDLASLAPTLEKATGVATWVAQLEQVVVATETTIWCIASVLLLLALSILQIVAAIFELKAPAKSARTVARGLRSRDSAREPTSASLLKRQSHMERSSMGPVYWSLRDSSGTVVAPKVALK